MTLTAATLFSVERHLPRHDVRHVPPLAEELHHLLAGACHLRPMGFRVRVLHQSPNLVAIEDEIHLPQPALGSAPDRVAAAVQFDDRGILDERLPPDLDQHLLE